MIGIVDYGLGNIKAFANIYKLLNVPYIIASKGSDLVNVSKIILPGVGAFDQAIKKLRNSGMKEYLDEMVLSEKRPVLGICVGMQMLTTLSEEGVEKGFCWIDGGTKKFSFSKLHGHLSVPHMGWNNVRPLKSEGLFKGLGEDARFYFLHSYYVDCNRKEDVLALTMYGEEFVCAVNHDNIYGVQFHPEKSHQCGVRLLKNFWEL